MACPEAESLGNPQEAWAGLVGDRYPALPSVAGRSLEGLRSQRSPEVALVEDQLERQGADSGGMLVAWVADSYMLGRLAVAAWDSSLPWQDCTEVLVESLGTWEREQRQQLEEQL